MARHSAKAALLAAAVLAGCASSDTKETESRKAPPKETSTSSTTPPEEDGAITIKGSKEPSSGGTAKPKTDPERVKRLEEEAKKSQGTGSGPARTASKPRPAQFKLGERAPEIGLAATRWINSAPLTLDKLEGKNVVLIDFLAHW